MPRGPKTNAKPKAKAAALNATAVAGYGLRKRTGGVAVTAFQRRPELEDEPRAPRKNAAIKVTGKTDPEDRPIADLVIEAFTETKAKQLTSRKIQQYIAGNYQVADTFKTGIVAALKKLVTNGQLTQHTNASYGLAGAGAAPKAKTVGAKKAGAKKAGAKKAGVKKTAAKRAGRKPAAEPAAEESMEVEVEEPAPAKKVGRAKAAGAAKAKAGKAKKAAKAEEPVQPAAVDLAVAEPAPSPKKVVSTKKAQSPSKKATTPKKEATPVKAEPAPIATPVSSTKSSTKGSTKASAKKASSPSPKKASPAKSPSKKATTPKKASPTKKTR